MASPDVVTIGAYGWDAEAFFAALLEAHVDTFCDIRQRRSVRGREYAFANSQRLQARLGELGIRYVHCPELAPSRETREAQYAVDKAEGTTKRKRMALAPTFIEIYRHERLDTFDSQTFVDGLRQAVSVLALFCVERDPEACHRSLVAARLARDLGARVIDLTP